MLRFTNRLDKECEADFTLTLPFDQRIKGRLKVTLDDGTEAGIFLARGPILRNGNCIATEQGETAKVIAAPETVSSVYCDDALLLSRVSYHLGNRHTPLQIEVGVVRFQHDHVLDDMVRALGLEPICEDMPFEPEPGAYGEHNSDHAAGHSHGHSGEHNHAH